MLSGLPDGFLQAGILVLPRIPHPVLQDSTCLATQSPKCLSYSRLDLRVDGCPFLKQVVNAGEGVLLVVLMDD